MPTRLYISDFELMVLLAVMRVGDEAYGVPITREIEDRTGRTMAVAAVSAALQRLEAKGLVSSAIGEPTAARGGRAKRFFRATRAGIKEARETREAFTALWAGLAELNGGTALKAAPRETGHGALSPPRTAR
jgi:DNA-binding PadR family transcriptional regulator